MIQLLEYSTDNISLHLRNIFKDKELDKNSVAEEYSATTSDGKNYRVCRSDPNRWINFVRGNSSTFTVNCY